MYDQQLSRKVFRVLNRHAPSIVIGALFLTFSGLVYMSVCSNTYENPPIHQDVFRSERSPFRKQSQPSKPADLTTFLMVVVMTASSNTEQRNTIRTTWLNRSLDDIQVKFVIGTLSVDELSLQKLREEQAIHSDMLLLSDHKESYTNLTNKLVSTYKWIHENVNFKYVLKVDDDSFVRLDEMFRILKSKRRDVFYWGFFDGRAHVKRGGKWKESNWYLCDRYLPYALGGGYVISEDLLRYVVANSKYLKRFLSEDVSLGAWLAPLDIVREHDTRFNTEFRSRGCNNAYIVTHKQSVVQMRELHNNLQKTGHLCHKEIKLRNSYNYDWKSPPTQCCLRNNSLLP